MCSQRSEMSRWPVEETGRNSVMPSTIPSRITAIQSGIAWLDAKNRQKTSLKCPGRGPLKSLLLLLPEHGANSRLGSLAPLAHLQLAENRVPADINPEIGRASCREGV